VLQNFARIASEETASFAPNRQFADDIDDDPYVRGRQKMGPTHFKIPGNFPNPPLANSSDTDDDVIVVEVYCSPPFPYKIVFL
jgi:hypothetical protein